MKNKLFRNCAFISLIFFLGFVALYAYAWIANPFPKEDNLGPDWCSLSIGHGKISIAHSRQPSHNTNRPGMFTYGEDGGGNLHITVAQGNTDQLPGCYLVFLNQLMTDEGVMSLGGKMVDNIELKRFGIDFYSFKYTASSLGCSKNDRASEMRFIGYGIYFSNTSHTVDKAHNWWTWMISLWYPIIFFGILPAIFAVKKLRGRKSASTKKTAIEK